MKLFNRFVSAILFTAFFGCNTPSLMAAETVKVGVLHSLSGTMAISETSLRDILLFAFEEINKSGGILGKQIEPVVADGASNWPLFAEKAKQLLEEDKVAAVFGCWTSVSRKSVLPVFEKDNGLLFYPVQYEGEELSKNIFYTAEAVNQQATPAVDYLLAEGKKKFYLVGTDYVYPQTTNLVLLEYLLSKGVPIENIGGGLRKDASGKVISAGKYTPFGHTDYQQIVSEIKQFAASGDACVISTLNGDTNVPFFKEYAASGLTAEDCPVVSFSISEDEFRGLPAKQLVGQLGCWTYFESLDTPANKKFIGSFMDWLKASSAPGIVKDGRVTCCPWCSPTTAFTSGKLRSRRPAASTWTRSARCSNPGTSASMVLAARSPCKRIITSPRTSTSARPSRMASSRWLRVSTMSTESPS